MSYTTKSVKIVGTAPLLLHNGRLANPMDPYAKEVKRVTSKRKKTDEDHAEIARLEWLGSIYTNADGVVCIPGRNLESFCIESGKLYKLGKAVGRAGVLCDGDFPLTYGGPKDINKLWDGGGHSDSQTMKVQQARIVRTRPRFDAWALSFTVAFDSDVVDDAEMHRIIENGGVRVGLGDSRPRFGRFQLTAWE